MTFQGLKRKRNFKNIKNYWDSEANRIGHLPEATVRDHFFRYVELNTVLNFLKKRKISNLLDAGCGNGFTTFYLARFSKKTIGIDYADKFIDFANKLKKRKNFLKYFHLYKDSELTPSKNNVKFITHDLINPFKIEKKFDVIVCSRVLINFPSKNLQKKVFDNLYSILKKNGYLILTEVDEDAHKKLSKLRKRILKEPLEKYWHNLYLNINFLKKLFKKKYSIIKVVNYEEFQVASKILFPYLISPLTPIFTCNFHKIIADLFLKNKRKLVQLNKIFLLKKKKDLSHVKTFILKKK